MGSPDPHTTSSLIDALKLAGGGIAGAALAAFGRNFFTTDGRDAREFRQEYREEIKRLREERARDREEIETLRDDLRVLRDAMEEAQIEHAREIRDLRLQVERLTTHNQRLLIGRTEARALLNALERRQNIVETPWPEDPEGGTP